MTDDLSKDQQADQADPADQAQRADQSGQAATDDDFPLAREAAVDPQRLLRISGVVREVLEEARRIRPEPGAVAHLRAVHGRICRELQGALPPKLYEELDELTPDPDPTGASLEELAIAHAEILGWLEGLFQGTHLAIQLQAAQALQDRQHRLLPGGRDGEERPDSRYL